MKPWPGDLRKVGLLGYVASRWIRTLTLTGCRTAIPAPQRTTLHGIQSRPQVTAGIIVMAPGPEDPTIIAGIMIASTRYVQRDASQLTNKEEQDERNENIREGGILFHLLAHPLPTCDSASNRLSFEYPPTKDVVFCLSETNRRDCRKSYPTIIYHVGMHVVAVASFFSTEPECRPRGSAVDQNDC